MIERSVVVFPAPLRPISVTTSPSCKRERHPLQDVRFTVVRVDILDRQQAAAIAIDPRGLRCRQGRLPGPPAPRRPPEIRLLHAFVRADLVRRAIREHCPWWNTVMRSEIRITTFILCSTRITVRSAPARGSAASSRPSPRGSCRGRLVEQQQRGSVATRPARTWQRWIARGLSECQGRAPVLRSAPGCRESMSVSDRVPPRSDAMPTTRGTNFYLADANLAFVSPIPAEALRP